MSLAVRFSPPMPTRPCDFSLSLRNDSVFADFVIDTGGLVSLLRISFDGHGCCHVGEGITKMSAENSRLLICSVNHGEVENLAIESVLRSYFRENDGVIWKDPLSEHQLL